MCSPCHAHQAGTCTCSPQTPPLLARPNTCQRLQLQHGVVLHGKCSCRPTSPNVPGRLGHSGRAEPLHRLGRRRPVDHQLAERRLVDRNAALQRPAIPTESAGIDWNCSCRFSIKVERGCSRIDLELHRILSEESEGKIAVGNNLARRVVLALPLPVHVEGANRLDLLEVADRRRRGLSFCRHPLSIPIETPTTGRRKCSRMTVSSPSISPREPRRSGPPPRGRRRTPPPTPGAACPRTFGGPRRRPAPPARPPS